MEHMYFAIALDSFILFASLPLLNATNLYMCIEKLEVTEKTHTFQT